MRQRPSGTALAVTVGLLLDAHDPDVAPLFRPRMRELAEAAVAEFPPRGPLMLRLLEKRWYRRLLRGIERVTVPGIFLHYLMRKLFIEDAVRSALGAVPGIDQLVVVGAGLDTLGARLALDGTLRGLRVIEVDHPLTQAVKRRALHAHGLPRREFAFVELDLTTRSLEETLRQAAGFDARSPSVFVAEGLLMYLRPAAVETLFRELYRLGAPGSRVVFTFMESDRPDRIRFRNLPRWYAPLLDRWLRRLGEPMHWAVDRARLAAFLAPLGWQVSLVADGETFRARYLAPRGLGARPLVDGEYVGVAARVEP
jgi:methyltransferase (TIGR00027 family)